MFSLANQAAAFERVLVHLRILGQMKTPWWTEDREAAKHKCLISRGFPSLMRATGDVSAAPADCCPQMHQILTNRSPPV